MKFKKFKFKKVKSTNNTAIRIIRETNYNLGMVIAETQSKGRGQYGKKWISIKGNLFLSIFFDMSEKKLNFKKFAILNAYLLKNILAKKFSNKIKIKWPNDLLFEKKKNLRNFTRDRY